MNRTKKKLIPDGQPHERRHPLDDGGVKITTFVPLRFKKRGIKKVVVEPVGVVAPVTLNASPLAITPTEDPSLLKALGRGHYWQYLLDAGIVSQVAEIADREGLHKVTINEALRLVLLAPDAIEATLVGNLPRTVTLESLSGIAIPRDWEKQREMIAGIGGPFP